MADQNGEIRSWDNAKRFIKSGEIFGSECSEQLEAKVKESNACLAPLEDPLQVDFGTHRWLRREEAYSDWLAWIVEQVGDSARVLPMFEIDDSSLAARCNGKPVVKREVEFDGRERRVDLVIKYGSEHEPEVLVVVEIKVAVAEDHSKKLADYYAWMERQPAKIRYPVLLGADAAKLKYEGFNCLLWRHVCIYLRRLSPDVYKRQGGVSIGAMILAFVGAVETNLLGLSRGDDGRISPLLVPKILLYLNHALSAEEHS